MFAPTKYKLCMRLNSQLKLRHFLSLCFGVKGGDAVGERDRDEDDDSDELILLRLALFDTGKSSSELMSDVEGTTVSLDCGKLRVGDSGTATDGVECDSEKSSLLSSIAPKGSKSI